MHGLKLSNMMKNKVGSVDKLPRRGTWTTLNKDDVSKSSTILTAKGDHTTRESSREVVTPTVETSEGSHAATIVDTARIIDPAKCSHGAIHADTTLKVDNVDTARTIDPTKCSHAAIHVDTAKSDPARTINPAKSDTADTTKIIATAKSDQAMVDKANGSNCESSKVEKTSVASLDEERFLKQKSKVHWLAEGDANTKYFHNSLKCRNHSARIDVITDSNGILHEGKAVPKAFVDHYVGFLGREEAFIIPITQELFDVRIDQAMSVDMIREVTTDEIKRTIFAFADDKAPGPDGFTAAFYKKAWDIVDDLFLFARGDLSSTKVIMQSLTDFAGMPGLSPSNQKSTIFFCNVVVQVKNSILNIMPFVEGKLSVRYLGVPLVASRVRTVDCRVLIERIENRIGDWKNKLLSFAGRCQLINSVVSSLHVFWSSVFILPIRIMHDSEAKMRDFLWARGPLKRSRARVAWKDVCMPKTESGLGIKRVRDMNRALMSFHIWSIISKRPSDWVDWIQQYSFELVVLMFTFMGHVL
ncbi:hypothetical protein QVD17_06957 [Tagetes erecta]|uniref:Uncharacterized protein n=1 Tax=Tagetes erecta TaxID=13708 RepID=A0AAD8LF79_TARER|nr:hypothetical protein QVD17_06957 [Tagetes erecta]